MTGRRVDIVGGGVAALTLAELLRDPAATAGAVATPPDTGGRVVAVAADSLRLLAELFAVPVRRLAVGRMIVRRTVAWSTAAFDDVPFDAVALELGDLVGVLRHVVMARGGDAVAHKGSAALRVVATGRAGSPDGSIRGGRRHAVQARIGTIRGIAADTIAIASTPVGWLFVAPAPCRGQVAMLVRPPDRLGQDIERDLDAAVDAAFDRQRPRRWQAVSPPVPCAAAFTPPVTLAGLRVGDCALALDPIRGDGVGFGARGALLACAVIKAGATPEATTYYSQRLLLAFRDHLAASVAHYEASLHAAIWADEIAEMRRALDAVAPQLHAEALRFRLVGRSLRPVAA